jgi:hypothetical protein
LEFEVRFMEPLGGLRYLEISTSPPRRCHYHTFCLKGSLILRHFNFSNELTAFMLKSAIGRILESFS